jgi:hypothetical protein
MMTLDDLSPEQVSQAFQYLANKDWAPPLELMKVPLPVWQELSVLLEDLMIEKQHSTIN